MEVASVNSLDEFSWEEASKRLLEIHARDERKDSPVATAVQDFHDDNERRGLKASGTKKYRELLGALLKFCEDHAITTVRAFDRKEGRWAWLECGSDVYCVHP